MTYGLSVDMALCAMKVSPALFETDFQNYSKTVCESMGLTPREAAVIMMARDSGADYPKVAEECIRKWEDEGSLKNDEPAVASALSRLGIKFD